MNVSRHKTSAERVLSCGAI